MDQQPLEIAQVVADVWKESAGTSYLVTRLAQALDTLGHRARLHTLEPAPPLQFPFPVTYYKRWRHPDRLGVSPDMRRGLSDAATSADVLHFHGLWMMPSVYPGWAVKNTDTPLVFSPHGMLNEWAAQWSKYRKSAFWIAMQKKVVERVDCFHATSDLEASAIREAGFSTPIAVVPIGIDVPQQTTRSETGRGRTLLYLGRLHQVKNVESLLLAWRAVQDRHVDWSLSIVGDGDALYVNRLKRLASETGTERVTFHGPTIGDGKDGQYCNADLYILPTFSENFGVTVAEALSHEVPVITTQGTPWSGLVDNGAGWWIAPDVASVSRTLDQAMGMEPSQLRSMGSDGRAWMQRDFTWNEVGSKMAATYGWLQGKSDLPAWVRTA